jgi:hypothetical protein
MPPNKLKKVQTISDWTRAMRASELEGMVGLAKSLETDRLADDRRVREAGLPCYDKIDVPYAEFSERNKKLMDFYMKHRGFLVRALPAPETNLPRRPKKGLNSFKECQEFIEGLFCPGGELHGKEKYYTISVTDYEPSARAGIIISNPEQTLIEMSNQGLEELSHGETTDARYGLFAYHNHLHFRTMRYRGKDPAIPVPEEDRLWMWKILQYIRYDESDGFSDGDFFPNIHFWTGYFELIETDMTHRVVFWDYKDINEAPGYAILPKMS